MAFSTKQLTDMPETVLNNNVLKGASAGANAGLTFGIGTQGKAVGVGNGVIARNNKPKVKAPKVKTEKVPAKAVKAPEVGGALDKVVKIDAPGAPTPPNPEAPDTRAVEGIATAVREFATNPQDLFRLDGIPTALQDGATGLLASIPQDAVGDAVTSAPELVPVDITKLELPEAEMGEPVDLAGIVEFPEVSTGDGSGDGPSADFPMGEINLVTGFADGVGMDAGDFAEGAGAAVATIVGVGDAVPGAPTQPGVPMLPVLV